MFRMVSRSSNTIFFDFWFAANTLRIVCGFEISFTVVEVNFRTREIKSFTVGKIRFTAGKVKSFTVGNISFRAKEVKSFTVGCFSFTAA